MKCLVKHKIDPLQVQLNKFTEAKCLPIYLQNIRKKVEMKYNWGHCLHKQAE